MAPSNPQASPLSLPGGVQPVMSSGPAKALMRLVERVAVGPASVLIQGETGTGKELIARALHRLSTRSDKPWVDINCAALPEHLIESELFGHEKGAFSGADSLKIGLFELANGGTLFLDEIGELDLRVQGKLLRVLDDAPYYRLGGTKKVPVDVRVIAATNRDLRAAADLGRFRSDLYFRLSQVQLFVPALRERLEDIEEIANQVLAKCRPGTQLSPEALQILRSYSWPGNIRELKNVLTSAAAMLEAGCSIIHPADLPKNLLQGSDASQEADASQEQVPTGDLDSMERLMIEQALKENDGSLAAAADALGISRRTLSRKSKAYRLEVADSGSLGSLGLDQYRYFRSGMERPIIIRSSRFKEIVESVNLSSTGLGIRNIKQPQKFPGVVDIEFSLTDSGPKIALKGRITWADHHGHAGIRFVSVSRPIQKQIDSWITENKTQEGWSKKPIAAGAAAGVTSFAK
jgi:transcriptional regulator with AAA-type ATPase domain